jgi:Glycosyltransferases, probably involved in cell wall biogenesis
MQKYPNYSFSIVIPCYNEKNYISNCLESILEQDYDLNLIEVIVVDGNSNDGTVAILEGYKKKLSRLAILSNPQKKTPRSLNIGIKSATGEVIVILSAHAKIDRNFIKYNNYYLHDKNVKVTGGTQYNEGLSYIQSLIGTSMEIPFAMASASYRWSKKEQFVDTVVYAAYKKELFEELGYFEEKFAISEDAEFNWRIRQAGYKIFFSPEIKSYYYPRNSISKFIKQMFRYGILRVNVLKKHTDSLKISHLVPPSFVLVNVLLLVLGLLDVIDLKLFYYLLGFYFALSIVSCSIKLFPKKMIYLPTLPVLIFLMHSSWGLGFIIGFLLPKSEKW